MYLVSNNGAFSILTSSIPCNRSIERKPAATSRERSVSFFLSRGVNQLLFSCAYPFFLSFPLVAPACFISSLACVSAPSLASCCLTHFKFYLPRNDMNLSLLLLLSLSLALSPHVLVLTSCCLHLHFSYLQNEEASPDPAHHRRQPKKRNVCFFESAWLSCLPLFFAFLCDSFLFLCVIPRVACPCVRLFRISLSVSSFSIVSRASTNECECGACGAAARARECRMCLKVRV